MSKVATATLAALQSTESDDQNFQSPLSQPLSVQ